MCNSRQGAEDPFRLMNIRDAMWLRDSANQIISYLPVLRPSADPNSLAALFRGVINAHSRYIKFTPYCHAFQPLPESKVAQSTNGAYYKNHLNFQYDRSKTFDCKWELDSLASFMQLSAEYYNVTQDIGPFENYTWVETIEVILDSVDKMRVGTYTEEGGCLRIRVEGLPGSLTELPGRIAESGYTMYGETNRATETTSNNGLGNPVTRGTGLIRSTFRPSDGLSILQAVLGQELI